MLKDPIAITSVASLSPLGQNPEQVLKAYRTNTHLLQKVTIGGDECWAAILNETDKAAVARLGQSDGKYKNLDASVLYAIFTARKAVQEAGWKNDTDFGINIGSSRGATSLFEKFHEEFLKNGKTGTLSSPTTTLGNISSWVAHDLGSKGPEISHSITCSTGLHSLLNGISWLQSGLCNKFLVGASEAAITPFTIAQMKALKIYAKLVVSTPLNHQLKDSVAELSRNESMAERTQEESVAEGTQNELVVSTPLNHQLKDSVAERTRSYPCRALDLTKTQNTMVLGEGAASVCLEKGPTAKAMAYVTGIGFATEPLQHNASLSADAECFQKSMHMALGNIGFDAVDAIVMHAPGTIKGDTSEYGAIKKVFGGSMPFLTTNKWKLGHTFGASGLLSIEMAILMLTHQYPVPVPFVAYEALPKSINTVMVNAVGFGGNAVSILLSKNL